MGLREDQKTWTCQYRGGSAIKRGKVEILHQVAAQNGVVFITNAQVQGEARGNPNVILYEEIVVGVLKADHVVAESAELVALIGQEVQFAVVGNEILREEGIVVNHMADIKSRGDRVPSLDPGQSIQELERMFWLAFGKEGRSRRVAKCVGVPASPECRSTGTLGTGHHRRENPSSDDCRRLQTHSAEFGRNVWSQVALNRWLRPGDGDTWSAAMPYCVLVKEELML